MKILSYKSGQHDATLCEVDEGRLIYSIEGEKNSKPRHSVFHEGRFESIVNRYGANPTVLCGDSHSFRGSDDGAYFGHSFDEIRWSKVEWLGKTLEYGSVPHELAHVACGLALSDFPQRQPCYVLLWEGVIGSFYHVDEQLNISKIGEHNDLLSHPGMRYILPYHGTGKIDAYGHAAAGKIMALAGLSDASSADYEKEIELSRLIAKEKLYQESGRIKLGDSWTKLYDELSYLRDQPVDDPRFLALCSYLQDEIFNTYLEHAKENISQNLPLIIVGGCGLNCNWNSLWEQSGFFSEVFVPPVPNDSGIAIGCAAAVQYVKTGNIKVHWSVYSGEEFDEDVSDIERHGYKAAPLDEDHVAYLLHDQQKVIAWVRGKYEIGPRALCHRSLIASPVNVNMRNELNRIKQREYFRPVAPVCLEEDVKQHFDRDTPSPYMLFFQKVLSSDLKAVTHYDNSARVQTVNQNQDGTFHSLLSAVKRQSGYGVLCNTSLNFPGRGFINNTSRLLDYVDQRGIDHFVINDVMYRKR